MKTLKALLVLCVALLESAAVQTRLPIRTAGPGYDGAIVGRDSPSGGRGSRKAPKEWTPTEHDVREAERLLPAYLASREAAPRLRNTHIAAQLSRYKRQYWGETEGSQRLIRILFYHEDTSVVQNGAWLRTAVSVAGGGDRYFQVTYEMDGTCFRNLWVNAPE